LVRLLLTIEDPSLVVVTGDIVSGKNGKNKPGWFEKHHRRFTKLMFGDNN